MLKVKHISHSDLDGHGGTLLISDLFLSVDAETEFNVEHISDYNKVDEAVTGFLNWKQAPEYDAFFITDLSMKNRETAEALTLFKEQHPNMIIQLIDHHASALWLNHYDWARVIVKDEHDKMHSATDLVYDYIVNELAPHFEAQKLDEETGRPTWKYMNHVNAESFADIVRSYDTYAWKNDPDNKHKEQARQFNQLMYMLSPQLFAKRMMMKELSIAMDPHEKLLIEVDTRQRDFYLSKKKKQAQEVELNETDTFAFVEAENEKNDVCDVVGALFPDAKFVLLRDGERLSFRVRSGDFKVYELAEFFDGGGHGPSAGGRIKNSDNISNIRLFEKVQKYYNLLLEGQNA